MLIRFCIILTTLISITPNGFANKQESYISSSGSNTLKDSINQYLIEGESLVDSIPTLSVNSLTKARKLAAILNIPEKEAYASFLLGQAKLNLKEYYEARTQLNHALTYYRDTHNNNEKAFSIYYLGLAEYHLEYYEEAKNHFIIAASIFKDLKKEEDYANAIQNLGMVYHSNEEFEIAKEYYLQALSLYKKLKNHYNIAGIYQNLGVINYNTGNDSLAISNYFSAIDNFKLKDDFKGIGFTYNNIGLFYLNKENPNTAFKHFEEALKYFEQANFIHGQMWVLNNIGTVKAKIKEFEAAKTYYNRSLEIAKTLNNSEGLITNYRNLSDLYEQFNQPEKSLAYYKKSSFLSDSLVSMQSKEKINKLDKLYQAENQEKEAIIIDNKNKRKRFKILALISFLSVFILAALVMISAYYQKIKAERKLADHKSSLQRLVDTRTIELRKQISERKVAEESDKLKSAFLANMSHELRTPMNAIIAFSNFLREPDLNEEKHNEYLDHITTAGDSLLRLIDDIIDIAKIESKQLKLFIQPTNINRLLNELYKFYNELRVKDDKKHIKFNLFIDNEFNYIINTDSQRLKQVLTNLIENAFKYTDKGRIEVGFSTTANSVTFYVEDTGIGIPKDKQDVIFTRFYQLNHIKDRRTGGTGLGLAISKNLVKLIGGKINVESEKGSGSKFSITIPVESIKKQPNPGYRPEEKRSRLLKPGYNWNNITILVAEDEDLNYKVLDTCLTRTKAHIIRAKDGASAVEICKNQKVDLVLMDIQMPGMDGYEATQEIKRMNNRTPVIAQTSFAMTGEKERCLQAGCDDFITKPLDIDSLLSKIEYYLK